MNHKGKIVRAVCPMCRRKEMYKHIKVDTVNPFNKDKIETWRCPDCVYVFMEQWFDKFDQYEQFLLRSEEDSLEFIKKFGMILKRDDEVKLNLFK